MGQLKGVETMDQNQINQLKAKIESIRAGMKITKVVCTRSVKGKMGDSFVGFSAAWNTMQDDGGQGLITVGSELDEPNTLNGMTLQEAIVAASLLGREVDLLAHTHALAGGVISEAHHQMATRAIKANYARMVMAALSPTDSPQETTNDNRK